MGIKGHSALVLNLRHEIRRKWYTGNGLFALAMKTETDACRTIQPNRISKQMIHYISKKKSYGNGKPQSAAEDCGTRDELYCIRPNKKLQGQNTMESCISHFCSIYTSFIEDIDKL